jgi:hypothetical protein
MAGGFTEKPIQLKMQGKLKISLSINAARMAIPEVEILHLDLCMPIRKLAPQIPKKQQSKYNGADPKEPKGKVICIVRRYVLKLFR